MIPTLLSTLDVKATARGWSLLINNIFSAEPSMAEDVVDHVRSRPFGEFFLREPGLSGRLLAAMEKVQPGCVAGWVASDETSLTQGLARGYVPQLEEVLVPLALFAGPSVSRVLERVPPDRARGLAGRSGEFTEHVVRGALALCGIRANGMHDDAITCGVETRRDSPIQLLTGLFDLNQELFRVQRGEFTRICADVRAFPSSVVLAMARFESRWEPESVRDTVRKLLRGGRPERSKGLEEIILATMLLGRIEWPSAHALSAWTKGHRALKTCIEERILRLLHRDGKAQIEGILNDRHPLVESIVQRVDNILNAVGHRTVSLSEWESDVRKIIPVSEADTWRSRLIGLGVIRPEIIVTDEAYEITFTRTLVDSASIYEAIGLPVPEKWAKP